MSVSRSLVANLTGQAWTALLNLASVPVYLHLLGVESFALVGLNTSVVVIASLLDAGLANTLNREMVRFRAGNLTRDQAADRLRSAELAMGLGAAVLAGAAWLGGPMLARAWLEPVDLSISVVEQALVLMFAAALLRVIEAIYRATLLGLDRPVLMNGLAVITSTVRVLGPALAIVMWSGDLLTFFTLQLAISALSLGCFFIAAHTCLGHGFGGQARRDSMGAMVGFAGGSFGATGLLTLLAQADKIATARLFSLETLGYYTTASIVIAGINQLALPVFQTYYPKLSHFEAVGDKRAFVSQYLQAALAFAVIAGVPLVFIALNAEAAIFAWTGDRLVAGQAGPLVALMAPGGLAIGMAYVPLAGFLATGHQRFFLFANLAALIVAAPAMVAGAHWGSVPGLAIAWSGAAAAWILATVLAMRPMVLARVSHVRLWVHGLAPLACAALLTLAARWLHVAPGGRLATVIYLIVAGGAVFAISALASLWAVSRTAGVRAS